MYTTMNSSAKPNSKHIRVRMAPSPTGHLHIGGVRTALYNVLFAKKSGGTCILRIEDTDEERSTPAFEKDIRDSFAWVGLSFDEGIMPDGSSKGSYGPYRQTERLDLYAARLKQLLDESKAYYCFCTKEELDAQRTSQEAAGLAPKYNGRCRSIEKSEAESRLASGAAAVIRLKVHSGKQHFTDLIRGEVTFDNDLIGDIVIAKNLRSPLYNFAVVIDDETMNISHVIRGEEHLANTPKQLLIGEALGVTAPQFAHLPIILSATGKGKMSKRDGGTTVGEYRDSGYLPEAMINFLVLIGWHPMGDRELLSFEEMISEFSLERVQKGGAAFDKNKLDFFNAHYLKQLPVSQLVSLLSDEKFSNPGWRENAGLFEKVVSVVRDRLVTLADFKKLAELFFVTPTYDTALLTWKKSTPQAAKQNLEKCRELLREVHDAAFTKSAIEALIMPVAEQLGKGDVLWPLRVALSGKDASPPPIELAEALGKVESLSRIETAISKLASLPA
jgi:glutamyl-tRNA synthetase